MLWIGDERGKVTKERKMVKFEVSKQEDDGKYKSSKKLSHHLKLCLHFQLHCQLEIIVPISSRPVDIVQ